MSPAGRPKLPEDVKRKMVSLKLLPEVIDQLRAQAEEDDTSQGGHVEALVTAEEKRRRKRRR